MFTGIIIHRGTIEAFELAGGGARLRIRTTDPEPFARGESLAVNGVCLTVLPEDDGALVADLSDETLARTTLAHVRAGTHVNVERAMRAGERLGGHLVQGHVDAPGALLSVVDRGEFAVYRWSVPREYANLLVDKGSVAVDGVSLTVVEPDADSFGAALIPETLRRTNLGNPHIGGGVNLEFDVVAKYVRQLVAPYLAKLSS
jgi:riboflavin synthase